MLPYFDDWEYIRRPEESETIDLASVGSSNDEDEETFYAPIPEYESPDASLQSHILGATRDYKAYRKFVDALIEKDENVAIPSVVKVNILVTLWFVSTERVGKFRYIHPIEHSDFDNIWNKMNLSFDDVYLFATVMDGPRKCRALQKRLEQNSNMKWSKRGRLEYEVEQLQMNYHGTNLTSSVVKRVRNYIRSIPETCVNTLLINAFVNASPELTKYFLKWQEVADICHLKESDFQNPAILKLLFPKHHTTVTQSDCKRDNRR